jgi:hypothetical protein
MATITQSQSAHNNLGITPYGNLTALHFVLETNATGAAINSNSTAAIALGDVVRLGVLPAGFKLIDSQVVVQTGMTASVTGNLGFAYTDGVDVAATPQDVDYFGAALALSSAARLRNATANAAVVLPKDAYLTLTTAGAANAKASRVEVTVYGIVQGVA